MTSLCAGCARIWKGKYLHLRETLSVISSWLAPHVSGSGSAEKGKMTQECLHVAAGDCPVTLLQSRAVHGIKTEQSAYERSCERNVASYSKRNLEAVSSILIAAWGFNGFWLTGRKPVRCLKQTNTRARPAKCCVWVPKMASQNLNSSFCERYKHTEHQT